MFPPGVSSSSAGIQTAFDGKREEVEQTGKHDDIAVGGHDETEVGHLGGPDVRLMSDLKLMQHDEAAGDQSTELDAVRHTPEAAAIQQGPSVGKQKIMIAVHPKAFPGRTWTQHSGSQKQLNKKELALWNKWKSLPALYKKEFKVVQN